MNSISVSIIASPLQLLNAVEAINYFKTKNNILILMYNSRLNSIDHAQKLHLLNERDWNEIIFYDLGKITKKKRFFKQVKLIKKLKKVYYDYLFCGDFGTIQQALMANLNVKNIYLLDDGTATIVTYNRLKEKNFFQRFSFSQKMKLFRYILANLNYKFKQNVNFFTIFNLKSLPHMKVIQHNFSHLKSSIIKECKKSSNIYILGQNYVAVGRMTEEKYIEYLQKIIQRISKKYHGKIIYKPHRSEIVSNAYKSLVNENFFIDGDISQGPIETSLIHNHIYPSVIVSFISSALFTLEKIFPDSKIYSIRIKQKDLLVDKATLKEIDDFYCSLKSTSVILVDDL